MVMRQDARRYAMERVSNILSEEVKKIREKHTKKGKKPEDMDMAKAIRDGDCCLKRGYSLKTVLDKSVREAFDFSWMDVKEEYNEKAAQKDLKLVRDKAAIVKDAIMLKDEKEAMKQLDEFIKMCK